MPWLQAPWILVSAFSCLSLYIHTLTNALTAFFYPQESPEAVEYHKSQALGGRLTDVKDIAPLIAFLVTGGQWITGQTIFANGGYTTR